MNTHHIKANHTLAHKAKPLVQALFEEHGDVFIAVRGLETEYENGETDERVYTVSLCPNQEQVYAYEWQYVSAKEWLEHYETPQFGIVDGYGRECFSTRFKTLKEAKDALQAFVLGNDEPHKYYELDVHNFSI
jgi:hypothetical protein